MPNKKYSWLSSRLWLERLIKSGLWLERLISRADSKYLLKGLYPEHPLILRSRINDAQLIVVGHPFKLVFVQHEMDASLSCAAHALNSACNL